MWKAAELLKDSNFFKVFIINGTIVQILILVLGGGSDFFCL